MEAAYRRAPHRAAVGQATARRIARHRAQTEADAVRAQAALGASLLVVLALFMAAGLLGVVVGLVAVVVAQVGLLGRMGATWGDTPDGARGLLLGALALAVGLLVAGLGAALAWGAWGAGGGVALLGACLGLALLTEARADELEVEEVAE